MARLIPRVAHKQVLALGTVSGDTTQLSGRRGEIHTLETNSWARSRARCMALLYITPCTSFITRTCPPEFSCSRTFDKGPNAISPVLAHSCKCAFRVVSFSFVTDRSLLLLLGIFWYVDQRGVMCRRIQKIQVSILHHPVEIDVINPKP